MNATQDPLLDFAHREISFLDRTKVVHVAGEGPAVIVLTEMPGISPQVARLARWIKEAGFTVYMPSLFGRDGHTESSEAAVEIFRKTCVSAEFRALANGGSAPVTQWLRDLARLAHSECGGPGTGVIGMCFTGGFAMSMLLEQPTRAAVVCQPSLPIDQPAQTGISQEELAVIRRRLELEDLTVRAYRFVGDNWCRAERFAAYQAALGDRFIPRELPDDAANPEPPPFFRDVVRTPHSVVTAHLIDRAGEPTIQARDEILRFFTDLLHHGEHP